MENDVYIWSGVVSRNEERGRECYLPSHFFPFCGWITKALAKRGRGRVDSRLVSLWEVMTDGQSLPLPLP